MKYLLWRLIRYPMALLALGLLAAYLIRTETLGKDLTAVALLVSQAFFFVLGIPLSLLIGVDNLQTLYGITDNGISISLAAACAAANLVLLSCLLILLQRVLRRCASLRCGFLKPAK